MKVFKFMNFITGKTWLFSVMVCGIVHSPTGLFGQIEVSHVRDTSQASMVELVRTTLIGNGVLTGKIRVHGSPKSIGTFSMSSRLDLVKEGLVLSTGKLSDMVGPNDTTSTSSIMQTVGDLDLGKYLGSANGDAVSIEFDFIPFTDSIAFHYFFASEEYPEYVGKGFNDAFAFLINGPGYPLKTNIARLSFGAMTTPITIDNVNFIKNPNFYIPNHLKEDIQNVPKKARRLLTNPMLLNEIEFDGMTTRLRAVAKVTPEEIYTLKIVIADVGDLRYDSGVFLEKESFYSPASYLKVDTPALLRKFELAYENDSVALVNLRKRYPRIERRKRLVLQDSIGLSLHFDTDSFVMTEEHIRKIEEALLKLKLPERFEVVVRGHTDASGQYAYNVKLSRKRANHSAQLLKDKGIDLKAVSWAADKEPKGSNKEQTGKSQNRRVDILFVKK